MKTKPFALISWVGFLVSAVAEWGLEIDFPLTPALWLAMAAVAFFSTTTHAALTTNFWIDTSGGGQWEIGSNWNHGVPSTIGQSAVGIAGGGFILKVIIVDA